MPRPCPLRSALQRCVGLGCTRIVTICQWKQSKTLLSGLNPDLALRSQRTSSPHADSAEKTHGTVQVTTLCRLGLVSARDKYCCRVSVYGNLFPPKLFRRLYFKLTVSQPGFETRFCYSVACLDCSKTKENLEGKNIPHTRVQLFASVFGPQIFMNNNSYCSKL